MFGTCPNCNEYDLEGTRVGREEKQIAPGRGYRTTYKVYCPDEMYCGYVHGETTIIEAPVSFATV